VTDRVSARAKIVYIRSALSARHGTGKAAHTEVRLQLLELLLAPVAPSRSHKHEQVHVLGVAHHRLLHLVLCGKGLDRGPPAADTQQFINIIRLAQVWISSLMLNKSVSLSCCSLALAPYATRRLVVSLCARACAYVCARVQSETLRARRLILHSVGTWVCAGGRAWSEFVHVSCCLSSVYDRGRQGAETRGLTWHRHACGSGPSRPHSCPRQRRTSPRSKSMPCPP
jgi:hypothetical protein